MRRRFTDRKALNEREQVTAGVRVLTDLKIQDVSAVTCPLPEFEYPVSVSRSDESATEFFFKDLTGCARCHGEGHLGLKFRKFTHPYVEDNGMVMTHWATCPSTGQPILYGTQEKPPIPQVVAHDAQYGVTIITDEMWEDIHAQLHRLRLALKMIGYSKHTGSPRFGTKAQVARWGLMDEDELPSGYSE